MYDCFNVLKILDITAPEFDQIYNSLSENTRNLRLGGENTALFDSDWVPPTSFIKKLSKQLPSSTFIITGDISEVTSICKTTIQNGEILEVEELKYERRFKNV